MFFIMSELDDIHRGIQEFLNFFENQFVIVYSIARKLEENLNITYSYYLESFHKEGFEQYSYNVFTYGKRIREWLDKVIIQFEKFSDLKPHNNNHKKNFYNRYIQKTDQLLANFKVAEGNISLPEGKYKIYERTPEYKFEPNQSSTFNGKEFIILKNPQYEDVLNDIYKITKIEYEWLKYFYSRLISTYYATFPKSPVIFEGSMEKLQKISNALYDKGFISEESTQPFIDYLTGKEPTGRVQWLRATSSFSVFIEQFLKTLKKPRGNKTWAYFEKNPIFVDQNKNPFERIRNTYDQVNLGNYEGKSDLDEVLNYFKHH